MAQPFPTPDGYVWTGTVYARIDPLPGDPANILTPSQMAASAGVAPPPTQPTGWQTTPDGYYVRGDSSVKYTADQAAAMQRVEQEAAAYKPIQYDEAGTRLSPNDPTYGTPMQRGAVEQAQAQAPKWTQGAPLTGPQQSWTIRPDGTFGPSGTPAPTPAPAPIVAPPPGGVAAPTPAPAPIIAPPPGGVAAPTPAPGGAGGSGAFPGASDPIGGGGNPGGGGGGVGNPSALTRTQALQYIYNYPDLQTAWEASGMDPVQFANSHYSLHGQGEQRTYEPVNNFSNALGLGAQSNYYPVGQNRVSPQLSGGNGEIAQQLHNRMQGQRQMSPTSAGLAALYGYGTTGAYSPQMPFYTPFTGYAEVDGPGKARYFDAYKDVRDAYYNDANVGRGNEKSNGYMDQYTPAQFAALHFNTYGEAEGRVSPYGNDGLFTTRFTPTVMQNFNKAPAKTALADKAEEIADDAAATARAASENQAWTPNGQSGLDGGG